MWRNRLASVLSYAGQVKQRPWVDKEGVLRVGHVGLCRVYPGKNGPILQFRIRGQENQARVGSKAVEIDALEILQVCTCHLAEGP